MSASYDLATTPAPSTPSLHLGSTRYTTPSPLAVPAANIPARAIPDPSFHDTLCTPTSTSQFPAFRPLMSSSTVLTLFLGRRPLASSRGIVYSISSAVARLKREETYLPAEVVGEAIVSGDFIIVHLEHPPDEHRLSRSAMSFRAERQQLTALFDL